MSVASFSIIFSYPEGRMNLSQPIIQSEVSQKGKDEYHILKHGKAIPKNAQTTAQLHSSHTLVK